MYSVRGLAVRHPQAVQMPYHCSMTLIDESAVHARGLMPWRRLCHLSVAWVRGLTQAAQGHSQGAIAVPIQFISQDDSRVNGSIAAKQTPPRHRGQRRLAHGNPGDAQMKQASAAPNMSRWALPGHPERRLGRCRWGSGLPLWGVG